MGMPSKATVLLTGTPGSVDLGFARVSEFLGLDCRMLDAGNSLERLRWLIGSCADGETCVAASCSTLASLLRAKEPSDALRDAVSRGIDYLFVYGFSPGEAAEFVLPYLTHGRLRRVSFLDDCSHQYAVTDEASAVTGAFSGLRFGPTNRAADFTFQGDGRAGSTHDLISIDGRPFFTMMKKGRCALFLVACSEILDVYGPATEAHNLKGYFSRIVPAMMFLKHVFRGRCWHTDATFANLIIDDPLLRAKYGFLDYKRLLQAMDEHGFASTIAFIPWNFRRTSTDVAELVRRRREKFTLCMHGCNHTKDEFGQTDCGKLHQMITVATRRMEAHRERTGLSFSKVMVFPRLAFSVQAMKMLRRERFLGAVNSHATPFHFGGRLPSIADYLDLAVMRYEGLPLFLRRQPWKIPELAFDAFAGKPLLLETHHYDFKYGYDRIGELVDQVAALSDHIEWIGLGDILRQAYMVRENADGTVQCRMYGDQVLIRNRSDSVRTFTILKTETNRMQLQRVLIDDPNAHCSLTNGRLQMITDIPPRALVSIEVQHEDAVSWPEENRSRAGDLRVAVRRHLSEFRDNYVSRSDLLLSLARWDMRC